ncbi:hypothetical protein MA16_Dca028779 [Dendrobium catenatum]|uniref:Uncharacterized protein n=1 Tax=Dendrobium catenatum TaxID=906689 RepID=A0A2I0VDY8_9ASPA|nr:hypothetical protein MA16_Dca028779 [Dendrobium catenatum]
MPQRSGFAPSHCSQTAREKHEQNTPFNISAKTYNPKTNNTIESQPQPAAAATSMPTTSNSHLLPNLNSPSVAL